MRALTIPLLVACLLGSGAGLAAAQSPSPDSMAVKRIEVPAAGIAVTYPESWRTTVAPWDLYQPHRDVDGLHHIMARDDARPQTCDLYATQSLDQTSVSLDDKIEALRVAVESDPNTRLLTSDPDAVSLPAGEATRVDFTGHDSRVYSYWFMARDRILYLLACNSPSPPDDHWLSIAVTIELVPAEG